jgi:class 3 adenylate cyclase/tetratricopeptide (TPR) repeat protein
MAQQCATCHENSPDVAKFCLECGTPFARGCPSCGLPAGGGKFCMECGTPLAPGAVRASSSPTAPGTSGSGAPVSERRTTSVLFGDLVAFTTLSESRDPEEVRELLSEYFAVARTVVGRYGGTIEKFIGDAVMAVWGVPVSREDDAERAVRAGLDLVTEVAALGMAVGAPGLSMRVGITTGSVAVTLGAVNEGMVAGDAVNTAARVQTAAEPGTVWVDQETRGLTAAAVAFSDMGEHALKGKAETARLFRADTIVAVVGGAQRVDGLEAPMAGRDAELRRVKELFHATETDGTARIVLVTGVAGVGKSRLGWEYEKYTDGISGTVKWHRGRCLSYGDGVAFWAFAEMVRSRLGLLEGDERDKVDLHIAESVATYAIDAAEAAWLAPRLTALLRPGDGTVFERNDLFTAWTTFLERVGGEDPVLLVFEDGQHADAGLLDLIEHLLSTCGVGLFVVVMTRPELLERRPSLASGRRATVINLEPLDDDEMTRLVDALVDDLPIKARSAIVARAEGVPLYAVETVRSLIDRDAVQARNGRYVFVDHDNSLVDLDQLAAPTSLQMLISARLDSLSATERRTVQDASVLGMSFRQTGLMQLSDVSEYDLEAALAALTRKGVIETQDDPRSPERGQYRFLQALVREVAYSTLARKDRRERHLATAAHLESGGEGSSDAVAGIVAQHLLDALDASRSDDPERGVIVERARERLTTAAVSAAALGSPHEALSRVLVALTLDPAASEAAALHLLGARVALDAGAAAQADELAARAIEAYGSPELPTELANALVVRARAGLYLGRSGEATAYTERCEELLDAHPDIPLETRIGLVTVQARVARALGNTTEQVTATLRLSNLAEESADPATLVHALNSVAIMHLDSGTTTASGAILDRCIAMARDGHLLLELGRTLNNVANLAYLDDLSRAFELCDEGLAVLKRVGDAYYTEGAIITGAQVWWVSGDWDRMEQEIDAWLLDHEPTSSNGRILAMRAQVDIARGRQPAPSALVTTDDAWEQNANILFRSLCAANEGDVSAPAAEVAVSTVSAFGEAAGMLDDFELMLTPAVELQVRAGDLLAAERLLALFAPLLGGRGRAITRAEVPRLRGMLAAARGEDPERDLRTALAAHESYGAPYLLAQTRYELASWLLKQGSTEEATGLLDQARETFARLGAVPAVEKTDALRREALEPSTR